MMRFHPYPVQIEEVAKCKNLLMHKKYETLNSFFKSVTLQHNLKRYYFN
jgi:hypothetical protein